jgi:hypothetical protein
MQKTNLKKLVITLLIFMLIITAGFCTVLITCGPPKLAFEQIIISKDIKKDTNEPINPKSEFEITSKQIYATIKYTGAKGSDSWQFKWANLDTGEIVLDSTKKYNESQPEAYFQGIIASNIVTTDEAKIFQGTYKVEYYHNGELKQSSSFKVVKPEIQILEFSTASEIDIKGAPVTKTEQFNINQIVYACVKLDYLVTGNILKAIWKKADDSLIEEEEIEITSDYYEPSYIWFSLELSGGLTPIEPGAHKVEIYLNDNLYDTFDFEVIMEALATFNQGTIFSDNEFGFSIGIPDNWSYQEEKSNDLVSISIIPPEDAPAEFVFMATGAAAIKPYDDFIKQEVEKVAKEKNWTFADLIARDYNLKNGTPTREIMYLYTDSSNKNWAIAYSIIEYKDNAYIYKVIVDDQVYGDIAEAVYYGMLDTLIFK